MRECKINHGFIRIDFFRVCPQKEQRVIDQIKERSEGKIAIFQTFGHYDLMAIYSGFEDRRILFKGGINGIKSFSYMDCFLTADNDIDQVLVKLSDTKCISVSIFSMDRKYLAMNGGIICEAFSKHIVEKSVVNLLSLQWGEQIFIRMGDGISKLWEDSRSFVDFVQGNAFDIHTIIGVNSKLFQDENFNTEGWDDQIGESLILEWNVELKSCVAGKSLVMFMEQCNKIIIENQSVQLNNTAVTFSDTKVRMHISASRWSDAFRIIKIIRKEGNNYINRTRLRVLKNG